MVFHLYWPLFTGCFGKNSLSEVLTLQVAFVGLELWVDAMFTDPEPLQITSYKKDHNKKTLKLRKPLVQITNINTLLTRDMSFTFSTMFTSIFFIVSIPEPG